MGSARTALFNYLYAKKHNGVFVLRIEDTDKERSKKEFEENIINGLEWLGLQHDTFYRQSERTDIYQGYLQQLIDSGDAYISEEEAKDGSGVIRELVRFKNPNKRVTFTDEIRGEVTFDTTELGDFVIAKGMDSPLYHFVVVVDDFEMNVTHVIRGEDHISNTPRQILIQEAIGAGRPLYAHIPLILAEDRSKLSKRNGARSVQELKEEGFLPEALDNFLALIGWNPGDNREIFTLEELIDVFSLEKIQKGGAVFNQEKLLRINKQHMTQLEKEKLLDMVKEAFKDTHVEKFDLYRRERIRSILPLITERIYTLGEIRTNAKEGEYDFYFTQPSYDPENLLWKKNPAKEEARNHLKNTETLLRQIDTTGFTAELVKSSVWEYAEKEGRGDVLWPLRYALSGRDKSPDPFTLAEVLGKEETLKRIQHAITLLS